MNGQVAAHSTINSVSAGMPHSDAVWATAPMPSLARPGAAQGNPVNKVPRSHSNAASAAAKTSAAGSRLRPLKATQKEASPQ